jgi:hypothetical protein
VTHRPWDQNPKLRRTTSTPARTLSQLLLALAVPAAAMAQIQEREPAQSAEQKVAAEDAARMPRPNATEAVKAPQVDARSASGGASAVATIVLDRPGAETARKRPGAEEPQEVPSLLHGFRLGYVFVANYDEPIDPDDPDSSLRARNDLQNPHQFLLGYEVMNRMAGSGWLNVLLIGNFSVTGLEQSKLFPSANLLLGFELDRSFQAGVGINLMPVDDKPAHMIVAAGWTPRTGDVYLPLHVFLIPDIDGNHRLGTTFGVNWEI